ncbi:reverse transcriptase [Elysia marginata]|uniref:Reverse transcriptase n=1 Tax=Elysia marginata TaxID=1093978 RepID=A0AAV4EJV2_9GAST|nr:reverse transcriptase [Elysia marginata]
MVELKGPYKSKMEQAHTYKKEKYMDLNKEQEESGYRAKIMPIEIVARGFAGSPAYGLLSSNPEAGKKKGSREASGVMTQMWHVSRPG